MPEERIARYILDRRLARGGMAEVFLARQLGPEGYARTCVVKRVLPLIADDAVFVRMFLDEARVTSQLTHPNIAQIYDFGEEGGVYYLAMEYVPGVPLRTLTERAQEQGELLPCAPVARLLADAARALDYAHNARGQQGEPLNIVHRDVSPQNILLSRSGVVKVIDFGIAKTDVAKERTGAGIVKGKYAYMAPEQVRGNLLDRRTDVYALGLVLYELLTNAPAIDGPDAMSLMTAAAMPHFRPIPELRADVPSELIQICARALAPNPEARYATAQALSQDLEAYVRTAAPTLSDVDLIKLLPPEESGLQASPPAFASAPGSAAPVHDTLMSGQTTARHRSWVGAWVGGGALLALAVGVVFFLWRPGETQLAPIVLAPVPPSAPAPAPTVVIPPRPEPDPVVTPAPTSGSRPAPSRHSAAERHRPSTPVPPPLSAPPLLAAKGGLVEFRVAPYAEVFLGEKSLGVTPFKPVELAAGHYKFKLVNPLSGKTEVREVNVDPGSRQTVAVDLSNP